MSEKLTMVSLLHPLLQCVQQHLHSLCVFLCSVLETLGHLRQVRLHPLARSHTHGVLPWTGHWWTLGLADVR